MDLQRNSQRVSARSLKTVLFRLKNKQTNQQRGKQREHYRRIINIIESQMRIYTLKSASKK